MNPTQDETTDTKPKEASVPLTRELPPRRVKMGPGNYQEVPADYPNRAAVRAAARSTKGFKKDKPFKGARVVK